MLALADAPSFPEWVAPVLTVVGMIVGFVFWVIAQQGRQREDADRRHAETLAKIDETYVRKETFIEYRAGMERQVQVVGAIHDVGATVTATYELVRRRFGQGGSKDTPGPGG